MVYTLTKSPAFATNLLSGPYSNTNVAEMFRGLIGSKDQDATKLVDFMRLDSALGKPVALIGAPIFDGPNQIGVIAIQLPTDEINRRTISCGRFTGWPMGSSSSRRVKRMWWLTSPLSRSTRIWLRPSTR